MRSLPGGAPRVPCELVARVRASAPSAAGVRLVAVDGHAGSGKSTFAAALAAALGGAPVVHLDDLASHASPFGWTGRLTTRVLDPLARGEVARYGVYDWERRAFTRTEAVAPAPVVLVEGVGAGRRAVRGRLALLVWMAVPRESAWERGQRRDGPALAAFWEGWKQAESAHFAGDPSAPGADILVEPDRGGYRVRAG